MQYIRLVHSCGIAACLGGFGETAEEQCQCGGTKLVSLPISVFVFTQLLP